MEMKLSISLICLTLATFLVQESNGMECYQCGSVLSIDAKCEDPFNTDGVTKVDCTGGSCSKSKLELNDQQYIARGCLPNVKYDKCAKETQGSNEVNVCYCTSDKCNIATSATFTMGTLLFTTVGTVLYNFI